MKSNDQATRCPACKTVFRVVADQLRVSEGWVRCGRCTNVFNASESMVDMDGGWARLSGDHAPATKHEGHRQAPAADTWGLPRTQAHRARQDGPDNDRLASKIEAAMSRAQQPHQLKVPQQPLVPLAVQPPGFQSPSSGGRAPAPAPASGLTFRRSVVPPAFEPTPPEAADQPDAPWDSVPGSPWPPAAQALHAPPPPPTRTERNTAEVPDDVQAQPPWADERWLEPASTWPPHQPPASFVEPAVLPANAPVPAHALPEPSLFDETRPESLWPATQAASSLEGLHAEPRHRSAPPQSAKPGFMRKAEREQRWRRPQMRALLVSALVGSVLLLLAQVTVAYRDLVAARYPASKPLLAGLCAGLGCTVQAARSIDSLAVESSGLVRVDKTPLYTLQVTLRNRANLELALPALDVTFTDSKGDVMSRKVLLPHQLGSTIDKKPGAHGGTVAAGGEITLQGTLQTVSATPETVAGYTVELFYP